MSRFRFAVASLALLILAALGRAESLTFICVSDTHWMVPDEKNDHKRQILAGMNEIAGKKFPAALKGATIGKPTGVLVGGDLVDGGRDAQVQWNAWTRDFGLVGTDGAVLKLPVYETWGNHDGGNKIVAAGIIARNKKRVGPISVSPENNGDGLNYSWDWGQLHLVTVGFYAANANDSKHKSAGYDPRHSLDFLINDLKTNVGDSKRPVLILQHANLPNESVEWWTAEQRTAYYEAIKEYNVVAIVDGHEAGGLYKWKGIDILGCNDINAGYWVVQIDGDQMIAARTTDGEKWTKTLSKTIETGKPREAKAEKPAEQPATKPE